MHATGPQVVNSPSDFPLPASDLSRSARMFFEKHSTLLLGIFFAALAIIGQVGQNVSLPLWTGYTDFLRSMKCANGTAGGEGNNTRNGTWSRIVPDPSGPVMDPYFVVSTASFSFVLIFGTITLVIALVQIILNKLEFQGKSYNFITLENDIKFPQWQLMLVGVFDALNGIFVVFASPPTRTAPFLQAILGNFLIPLTIIFRLVLLRKPPTLLRLICAIVVFIGLVFSLIPTITGLDKGAQALKERYLLQPKLNQILWPLIFMFGFIPAALMNVIEEKSLKDTRKINLFYFLFWTSLYQMLTIGVFFWVDIIPFYGFAKGIKEFGQNYWFAIQCFFGHAGCDYVPGLRGSVFIAMYVITYLGSGLLIRYDEGATYLAVVQALVTPLAALFWTLFDDPSCGAFEWLPHVNATVYFSIGGIVMMVPAIFLYNIGTFKELKRLLLCRQRYAPGIIDPNIQKVPNEKAPLLLAVSSNRE